MTMLISFCIALAIAIGGFFYYNSTKMESPTTDIPSEAETNAPSQMPALTSEDRSGQGLSMMPSDILRMENLQQLNLSYNNLNGALPAEIRQLQNLQVLNISNNSMTGLPAELGQLTKLRILNAANNRLTGLPHELGNLQKLEVLDLSGNDVSEQDLQIIRDTLPKSTQIIL